MKSRELINLSAWVACLSAILICLYVMTAPPIILAYYQHTGDGGIPSFYAPLMNIAFSDFGAPVIWYFNDVWHSELSAIGQMPEFNFTATLLDSLVGIALIGMICAPFFRFIRPQIPSTKATKIFQSTVTG